ncbi:MAG: gliding motility-associated C-terminal domain-containing protein [Bacteroidetes bacterium]|nr:gliding motility-associated C-terminal domain-containing protein [Bacteroidota bacterium]
MSKNLCRFVLMLFCSIGFLSEKSYATHIYGADFFYTNNSGLSYAITLVVYGDCSGASFPNLPGATPQVEIYNGSSLISTITLSQTGPSAGIEVTPVCPSQLSNTTCVSSTGTVPGVKKFTYTANYTLSTTSANWKFRFTGSMGSLASAGRSNSITNITSGTTMALEATLNNLAAPNSSPTYTTIPTPFFCIGVPANYNPGTVDPNGDAMTYALVPGLINPSGTVSYTGSYTATAPLAASSFSFSSTTGQLSFTPNLVQRSLVVNQVSEYRGSTLVGTSMREMTFVVINTCNNTAPSGYMSNASTGTIGSSGVDISFCKYSGTLTFNINPTDPEGDTINMSASGIPTGATFTITNNNTLAPTGSFSWNVTGVAPGTYTFFITYTDNGCPLSSKQTLAYTITINPLPSVAYSLVSPATCIRKARFNLTPSFGSPWNVSILQGVTTVHSFTGITGAQLDSLDPGNYTIHTVNTYGCTKDTSITLNQPPAVTVSASVTKPTCYAGTNGSITISGGSGTPSFKYAMGAGTYSTTNTFSSLSAGTYTFHIKDSFDCVKDTTITLTEPPQITMSLSVQRPRCNYYNSGLITVVAANGVTPYQYAMGAGPFSSTNSYTALPAGTYTFHVKDNNGCTRDSTFILSDSIVVHANATVTNVLCNGDTTGIITLSGYGGTSPYKYKKGAGTLVSSGTFNNLGAGTYNFHVQDVDSCYLDTAITVTEPTPLKSTSVVTHATCYSLANGTITITASGGAGTYTYALGAGAYSSANFFNGLGAGTYTLHIKDANACIKDTSITITQPSKLVFSNITITEPICFNTATGKIVATGSGGTSPYRYALGLGPFSSVNTFTGLSAGSYTLHLIDTNNCAADSNVTMTQPTLIVPAVAIKNSTCSDLGDGKVSVTATGGVPSYTYAMGSGSYSFPGNFSPLPAGTYTFHVQDSRLCTHDTTITIIDSTKVTANYAISNVKCYNDSTASIVANALTGKSPFRYAINTNPFKSSGSFTTLPIGSYIIHIKDTLGCSKDTTINITQPTLLVPNLTATNVKCYNIPDGTVTIFGSGGTPGYTYANGAGSYVATTTFTALAAATYTFHVKDANGCIKDTIVTITQPTPLKYDSLQIANVLCYGDSSGKVTVFPSGATPPYSYTSDTKAFGSSNIITGLNSGIHVIKLKDNNNCQKDTIIGLRQPAKLLMTAPDLTNPSCFGYTDGAITVNATSGTKPYTYSMNGGLASLNNHFTGLTSGTYLFTILDSNNCRVDTTVKLVGYPPIAIDDIKVTNVSCFGLHDGMITITPSGGIGPYKYKMGSNELSDNHFDSLIAGSYTFTILDSKDCRIDSSAKITEPEKLVVSALSTPNDCEGSDDGGTIKTEVTGGTMPYKYKWSSPSTSIGPDAGNLPNGKFMVWVTDDHKCADSAVSDVVYGNCCKIFFPNAFTPNGDSKNDIARILFKGKFTLTTLMIYNRFGARVFETNDVTQGWDGKRNGVIQDLDTYNYYIKGICGGQDVEYKGTIMLIQ